MSTHKHFDKICCVVLALTLILTVVFMNAESLGVQKSSAVMGYERKLFDTSAVHTIDIIMDDWEDFIDNCTSEEYYNCRIVIDNEAYKNVAIRAKGNTSLSQVASYGNDRYSFKIEFDHYDSTKTYHGLDKLCLNNIIQDNTYMKDYLCYQMMAAVGVASPLCSYAYVTVNGEEWGLYLAVEGVEESFLQRNYGKDYGKLYKPDSMSMGGGRGNGEKFDFDEFFNDADSENIDTPDASSKSTDDNTDQALPQLPGGMMPPDNDGSGGPFDGSKFPDTEQDGNMQGGQIPEGKNPFENNGDADNTDDNTNNTGPGGQMQGDRMPGNKQDGLGGGMNNVSDDVLLKYIDDAFESYSNIFDNAKTDVTDSDKTRLIESLKTLSSSEGYSDAVDIEKVIQYFVVHNFVLNFDSYTGSMIHNYYLYEKDGQLQMIPWDYNLAFGGFQSMGGATSLVNYPIDSPVSGGSIEDRPMIAWIFENEEYTELYHTYFSEFIAEYFDSGYFEEMIDSVISIISPYIEKDPTKFCSYDEFEKGASTLREFCLLRAESVSKQLNGTIGSTTDTQESETLVDAGEIQISDMGSMNNSLAGRMAQSGGNMQNTQGDADNNDFQQLPSSEDFDSSETVPSDSIDGAKNDESETESTQTMPGQQMQGGVPPDLENGGDRFGSFDRQMPDGNARTENSGPAQQDQTDVSTNSWLLISVSVAVLLFGLGFAFIYKYVG